MSFYICFDIYIQGSEFDKKQLQFLSRTLEKKEFELALVKAGKHNNSKSRKLASVDEHKVVSDFSDYYVTRLVDLKKKNKNVETLEVLNKIKEQSTNEEILARADYETIQVICGLSSTLDDKCLSVLDNMVNLYPRSEWTGLGLVWLAKTYEKSKRFEDAKSVKSILKSDFSFSQKIQKQIADEVLSEKF